MTDQQKRDHLAYLDANIDYWNKMKNEMMVEAFQRTREIYHGARKEDDRTESVADSSSS